LLARNRLVDEYYKHYNQCHTGGATWNLLNRRPKAQTLV